MAKQGRKIAVMVMGRQTQALRMSLGLTLANNQVTVFLLPGSGGLEPQDVTNLEAFKEMGGLCYSLGPDRGPLCKQGIGMDILGSALTSFDHVLLY